MTQRSVEEKLPAGVPFLPTKEEIEKKRQAIKMKNIAEQRSGPYKDEDGEVARDFLTEDPEDTDERNRARTPDFVNPDFMSIRTTKMAKSKRTTGAPNKTELIIAFHTDNPDAKPKAIAAWLKSEHKLDVKPSYVSTILSNHKRKNGGASATPKPVEPGDATAQDAVALATQLVSVCGSSEKAIEVIQFVEGWPL